MVAAAFVAVVLLVLILTLRQLRTRPRRTQRHRSRRGYAPRRKHPPADKKKKSIPKGNGHIPSWQKDAGARVANKYGMARSPEWPRVAQEHLSREPACVVCGHRGQGLQVHHIKPFHLYPELELDPRNLITLCEIRGRTHHLLIGHLDDWESYNIHVRTDAKRYAHQSATAIKSNPTWQHEVDQRPMP
ncbi:HNH endonuclease [Dictyobacter aurantiacus]|uniref:HNH endonuclease n=1 Tax=Dictyobacter aurantiacus TaxID=1936993 RepID=UPI00135AA588|nr:HNH endonuclease [Dictyobacter aurantiacus]